MFQRNQLISGSLLVLGINLLLVSIILILEKLFPNLGINNIESVFFWFVGIPFFWLIGLGQFLYVIPLTIWLIIRRRYEFFKGVTIGLTTTILLNGAACYFIVSR